MKKQFIMKALLALSLVLLIGMGKPVLAQATADDSLRIFLEGCDTLKEITHKNLTIIPVRAPEMAKKFNLTTLDEVIKSGKLIIKEVSESGQVNALALQNSSDHYVFIMAGEILSGAKQDRILQQDVLLPPNSNRTVVSAFCVEQGRWQYKSGKFHSDGLNATIAVRQSAKVSQEQTRVWREVRGINQFTEADTPTDTLRAAFNSPKMKKARQDYWQNFNNIPDKYQGVNGVIVLINGRVMVADLFSQTTIFKKLWKKLLDSYIAEAIGRKGGKVPSTFTSVSDFMRNTLKANRKFSSSPGAGQQVNMTSKRIKGSGIVFKTKPLHIDVFPVDKYQMVPPKKRLRRNYFQRRER